MSGIRKQIAAVEKVVAERYGVWAKYPPAAVIDRYLKWEGRDYLLGVYHRDALEDPRLVKLEAAARKKVEMRRDRLMLPAGYLSWEHIKAFLDEINRLEKKVMKQTGTRIPGYVLRDGKLVRDPKHLDASARRKRQAAAIKRKDKRK